MENDQSGIDGGIVETDCETKKESCPYTIATSAELGRYLVAARDLKARETIIQELPLVVGPSPREEKEDFLLCLACCARINLDERPPLCSQCFWPVCGATCEKLSCHAENECKCFSESHILYPPPHTKGLMYKSIMVLRCLLMKKNEPESWQKLITMEDHKELRKNTPKCYLKDQKILENFKFYFPKKNGVFEFDENDVIKICGIIDVNSHSVPRKIRGTIPTSECHIYLETSLLSHSCVPNSSWKLPGAMNSSSAIIVRTNIPIKKGETISVCYNNSRLMYGTLRRLIPMEMSGLFVCRCERCTDPSELGTNLSGIKCFDCEEGYLLPVDPLDSFSDWKCNTCESVQVDTEVLDIIEEAEDTADFPKEDFSADSAENLKFLQEYVENYSGQILHPNHYILQEVNARILTCQGEKSLERLPPQDLQSYIDRCEKLLAIADIITPGYCEYRSFLQFHLSKGLLLVGRRRITEKEPWDNHTAYDHFVRVLQMQEESILYLKENYTKHHVFKTLEKNIYDTKRFVLRLKAVQ